MPGAQWMKERRGAECARLPLCCTHKAHVSATVDRRFWRSFLFLPSWVICYLLKYSTPCFCWEELLSASLLFNSRNPAARTGVCPLTYATLCLRMPVYYLCLGALVCVCGCRDFVFIFIFCSLFRHKNMVPFVNRGVLLRKSGYMLKIHRIFLCVMM